MLQPFSPQIVAIAYFDDNSTDFDTLKSNFPAVGIIVLNLGLSDHPVMDPATIEKWKIYIQAYQKNGMLVLGYVPTDGGTGTPGLEDAPFRPQSPDDKRHNRTFETIKSGIDLWYNVFSPVQPDGIFLDEGPGPWRFNGLKNEEDDLVVPIKNFYIDLYTYLKKTKKAQTVMLNAAAYWRTEDDWILGEGDYGKKFEQNENITQEKGPAADAVVLFEGVFSDYKEPGGYSHYPIKTPSWWTSHEPARVCHIINSCSEDEVCNAINIAKSRTAGYVYVYDGTAAAYNRLPTFWKEELKCIQGQQ